jgi:hypothetical protein
MKKTAAQPQPLPKADVRISHSSFATSKGATILETTGGDFYDIRVSSNSDVDVNACEAGFSSSWELRSAD